MTVRMQCLGCRAVVESHRSGRCAGCRRVVNRVRDRNPARRARKRVLYDAEHRRERARWAPNVAAGVVRCWRCGELIEAGASWDLGHRDGRPSHPEHPSCNRSAQ